MKLQLTCSILKQQEEIFGISLIPDPNRIKAKEFCSFFIKNFDSGESKIKLLNEKIIFFHPILGEISFCINTEHSSSLEHILSKSDKIYLYSDGKYSNGFKILPESVVEIDNFCFFLKKKCLRNKMYLYQ